MVDVDEQHRRGEEEEHLPRVERAERGVDLVRQELERQPSRQHDPDGQDRSADLGMIEAAQPRVFHLVDKRQVLQRVEERRQQEVELELPRDRQPPHVERDERHDHVHAGRASLLLVVLPEHLVRHQHDARATTMNAR